MSAAYTYILSRAGWITDKETNTCCGKELLSIISGDRLKSIYTFLSVERSELDRNYAPSVCVWLYSM